MPTRFIKTKRIHNDDAIIYSFMPNMSLAKTVIPTRAKELFSARAIQVMMPSISLMTLVYLPKLK